MSEIVRRLRAGYPCAELGGLCRVRDAASGCLCAEAADTITRLDGGVTELSSMLIVVKLTANGEKARLEAEVERLRADLEAADAALVRMNSGKDLQALKDDHRAITAENERLRAALQMHACDCTFAAQCAVPSKCRNYLARAALTQEPKL